MLKKAIFTLLTIAVCGSVSAQTDSTDLDLTMSAGLLVTPLDSILYSGDEFEELTLEFTISDTLLFGKVHIQLTDLTMDSPIYKNIMNFSELDDEALISAWDITMPFGFLNNEHAYAVEVVIERYDGALGTILIKTYTP